MPCAGGCVLDKLMGLGNETSTSLRKDPVMHQMDVKLLNFTTLSVRLNPKA